MHLPRAAWSFCPLLMALFVAGGLSSCGTEGSHTDTHTLLFGNDVQVLSDDELAAIEQNRLDLGLALLDSLPKVLYLDFDGDTATGTPNSGFSAAEQVEIVRLTSAAFEAVGANLTVATSMPTTARGTFTTILVGGIGRGNILGQAPLAPPGRPYYGYTGYAYMNAGASLQQTALVIQHEAGHTFSLNHVIAGNDIMFFQAGRTEKQFTSSFTGSDSAYVPPGTPQDEPTILRTLLGTLPPPPLGSIPRFYDFGVSGSPVEPGYTPVTPGRAYSEAKGYGWLTGGVLGADRGIGTSLSRDFTYSPDFTFAVNLANDSYTVTMMLGDMGSYAHDQCSIILEGVTVDSVTTAIGEVVTRTFTVAVNDGQLTLRLHDLGGSDPNCVIESLAINQGGAAPPPPPPPVVPTKFDFGTAGSPVEPGYTQVLSTSAYAPGPGYGWQSGTILGLDRAIGSSLSRDFNYSPDSTFAVDLANDTYTVTIMLGDTGAYQHDQCGIVLEGTTLDSISTTAGQVVTRSYTVTISDGQLTLRLRDLGGSDPNCVIESLAISGGVPLPPPTTAPTKFDFGTATSPVESGYTQVLASSAYASGPGYGWSSGAIFGFDRSVGTSLTRDFNYSPDFTFAVDLTNEIYTVTMELGDMGGYQHDQCGIFLEGVETDSVTTAAGQVVTRSYVVIVNDGQLTLQLRDLGGSDPNCVIESLVINQGGTVPPPPPPPVVPTKFDFGTANSAVGLGYAQVFSTSAYAAARGYGWLSGKILSFDRGIGTSLSRDFNYSPDFTFAVDLANGAYSVTMMLGDMGGYLHDQCGIFLEGASVDSVTTTAGQVVTRNYAVTVDDGQLTVRLQDLGGADPNCVIESLEIQPN